MQFHFHANQSHLHKNGLALRLALKQRHKRTRKWPIVFRPPYPGGFKRAIITGYLSCICFSRSFNFM